MRLDTTPQTPPLREFLSPLVSPDRIELVRQALERFNSDKVPGYIVALLVPLVDCGILDSAELNRLIRALLRTQADKVECTDWLHRVFLPAAKKSNDKTLWATLALLAVYLGETAIARHAVQQSDDARLQHYLAWGLGDCQPAADDPLGGRSPLSNQPGSSQSGVTIGVFDYKSLNPEQANNNIGDVIQSVAFMRHLARFYTPHWGTGDPRLATAMQFLQRTWPEAERQPSAQPVNLRILDRDSAWAGVNPTETTYLPLYGWFAKLPFNTLLPLPLPPHIQPLFLGLHLGKPKELLTPDTIAWLKACEPIGCRDRTTTDWLASAGIQTFFAGCMTTTLQLAEGSISPPLTPRAEHYQVDTKAAAPGLNYTAISHNPWYDDRLSRQPFAANVLDAIDLLLAYQQAKSVHTSQLHCYLPCRALGTEVTYRPSQSTDIQLDGLSTLSQAELARMQTTLHGLTAQILAKILSGAEPTAVRATWRELTAPLVAATAAERNACTPLFVLPPVTPPIHRPAAAHAPLDPAPKHNTPPNSTDVVQIAMAFDANIARYVPNVVRSIRAHSSAAVAYHFLVDGVSAADQASLHQACPNIDCTWYDMAEYLEKMPHHRISRHLTRSTQSRLFLPEILLQVDKVIYLDVDIIVLGDIAELAATELGDAPLAAVSIPGGVQPISALTKARAKAANRIFELRRAASLTANLITPYFNAGVLVLSLDTLRRDHFTTQALRAATNYGLSNQQILNLYTGEHYVRLALKWNLISKLIAIRAAEFSGIIHWKGPGQPWESKVIGHDIWKRFS